MRHCFGTRVVMDRDNEAQELRIKIKTFGEETMKKAISTFALASILTLGTTFANGGIIVAGRPAPAPEPSKSSCQPQTEGIIVAGLTGIIVAGLTGIIVAGAPEQEVQGCFDPVVDTEGIIVAG